MPNENLPRIYKTIENLGIPIGEALLMINYTYGYTFVDSDSKTINRHKGIPPEMTDEIITFLKNNARDRYKIFDQNLHVKMLQTSAEYRRTAGHAVENKYNQAPLQFR